MGRIPRHFQEELKTMQISKLRMIAKAALALGMAGPYSTVEANAEAAGATPEGAALVKKSQTRPA
jgi:hypothetical protein